MLSFLVKLLPGMHHQLPEDQQRKGFGFPLNSRYIGISTISRTCPSRSVGRT